MMLVEDRITKLNNIRELGFSPYGDDIFSKKAQRLKCDGVRIAVSILDNPSRDSGVFVEVHGRVVLHREFGNLQFLMIRDDSGDTQIALNKKFLSDELWQLAHQIDLSDILAFQGYVAPTNKGEPTLWAHDFHFLAKSLVTPPSKHDGLQDVEHRYRQRYVDLWSNPEVLNVFKMRSTIISALRDFLYNESFVEVETPALHPIMGGAIADPFTTHHKVFDQDLYLRVAPELYLKKLIVGGFTKVFEIGKNFRNEGMSTKHNPEFSALEIYWAGSDEHDMRDLVQRMMRFVVDETKHYKDFVDPFTNGFTTRTMHELVGDHSIDNETAFNRYEEIENGIIDPTFVYQLPASKVPLAKSNNQGRSLSYELVVQGMEIGCIYREENDPEKQLQVLRQQANGDDSKIDWDFIEALKTGLPSCSGVGIGLDRLVMLMTGSKAIKDVILFPAMKVKE